MTLKVYNTMSRKLEKFKPISKKLVKMYCCGPTAHDYAHIGNLRTMIFYDVLKRVLRYNGYGVKQISNITDVDDKTIKKSVESGKTLKEYTIEYTKYFMEDLKELGLEGADAYPFATDNIDKMQEIILALKKKHYAYESDDGIYYDISKFKDYGKLSKMDLTHQVSRIKADEYDKESVSDFALWKYWNKADGHVFWEVELPKGRPGWHIECSAMAIKFLGDTIDIHSGAVDLIFPHHENEIAQSEAFTGKKFVNYWVHPGHLLVDGKKMSKSLKNFYTLRDVEALGFDPLSFKLLVMGTHYRSKLNFTFKALEQAEKTLDDMDITLKQFDKLETGDEGTAAGDQYPELEAFTEAINNDFDMPAATHTFFKVVDRAKAAIKAGKVAAHEKEVVKDILSDMDSVLGIIPAYSVPDSVVSLADERRALRERRDWGAADLKRTEISDLGYKIIDVGSSDYVIIKKRRYGA